MLRLVPSRITPAPSTMAWVGASASSDQAQATGRAAELLQALERDALSRSAA